MDNIDKILNTAFIDSLVYGLLSDEYYEHMFDNIDDEDIIKYAEKNILHKQ